MLDGKSYSCDPKLLVKKAPFDLGKFATLCHSGDRWQLSRIAHSFAISLCQKGLPVDFYTPAYVPCLCILVAQVPCVDLLWYTSVLYSS